jgi:hypothetical protein
MVRKAPGADRCRRLSLARSALHVAASTFGVDQAGDRERARARSGLLLTVAAVQCGAAPSESSAADPIGSLLPHADLAQTDSSSGEPSGEEQKSNEPAPVNAPVVALDVEIRQQLRLRESRINFELLAGGIQMR